METKTMKYGYGAVRVAKCAAVVMVLAGMLCLTACKEKDIISLAEPQTAQEMKDAEAQPATAAVETKAQEAKASESQTPAIPAVASFKAGNPMVTMKTSKGQIRIMLYQDKAPISVANFLAYVNNGFYNGTIFHRVIPGFMIQGGGMTPDMAQKPTKGPIKNEAANGLKNDRGTIAMARTNAPNSATSQFFINVNNNLSLNYAGPGREGYAVFGKVIEGMDVADAIVKVPTRNVGGHGDVPVEPIIIESVIQARQ
jgi:cyclophilin family peptidyl-prolyl cis-trans isomerase